MLKAIPVLILALFLVSFSCANSPSITNSEDGGLSADSLAPNNETLADIIADKDEMKEAKIVSKVVLSTESLERSLENKPKNKLNDHQPGRPEPLIQPKEIAVTNISKGLSGLDDVESDGRERIVEEQNTTSTDAKPPMKMELLSHEEWDKLLQAYVSSTGKVNYAGFKKDKARLEAYLGALRSNPPTDNWPRAEKMAYWINAYNAFTIQLIVDNYPVTSIMKLDGGKTWDVKRIKIGGKSYSLNNIEHDILRPQFKDARIHFAVNCAAKSCPPLLNRAWTDANLESFLDKQARYFINSPKYNKIRASEIQVSKIFEWYGSDFGNLISFFNKYSSVTIKSNAKIKFLEYDWTLNL